MLIYVVAFATAVLVCHLIVRSSRWHLSYTADHPGVQPQKFHTTPTPRVGGLGVLAGMVVAGIMLGFPRFETELYWLLILSLLPAFLGGFAEDVTRKVGPGTRLLLTVLTAAFAYALVGVHFTRSHMAWFDFMLQFAPFGYCALLFAVAGVAHSINIIDGYNGLAGGYAAITLLALGYVAQQSGDSLVTTFCYLGAAATLGFLILNYPFGRLFLGDGGAYLLGCTIALASALLVQRNPQVSPWFPLALVIYPVWETMFSMLRRALVYGTKIGQPDARHLHSLVYRHLSQRWARGRRADDEAWRNSLTALPFWVAQPLLALLAVAWSNDTRAQQGVALAFVVVYLLVYWRLARMGSATPAALRSPAGNTES